MADKTVPFRNPTNGLLLCPIRDFKDCEKEKCFFWKDGATVGVIIGAVLFEPGWKPDKAWEPDCLLNIASTLSSGTAQYFADLRDEAFYDSRQLPTSSVEGGEDSWPRHVRRRLERIESLLVAISRERKVVHISRKPKKQDK